MLRACYLCLITLTVALAVAYACEKCCTHPFARLVLNDVEFGNVVIGGSGTTRQAIVANLSHSPVRIVGASSGCAAHTCHEIKFDGDLCIPASGEAAITVKLMVYAPEPFDIRFQVFADDNGLRVLSARLLGRGVSP